MQSVLPPLTSSEIHACLRSGRQVGVMVSCRPERTSVFYITGDDPDTLFLRYNTFGVGVSNTKVTSIEKFYNSVEGKADIWIDYATHIDVLQSRPEFNTQSREELLKCVLTTLDNDLKNMSVQNCDPYAWVQMNLTTIGSQEGRTLSKVGSGLGSNSLREITNYKRYCNLLREELRKKLL